MKKASHPAVEIALPTLRAELDSALASLKDALELLDDEAFEIFLARRLARRTFSAGENTLDPRAPEVASIVAFAPALA